MFFLQYKTPHSLELKALAVFFSAFVHVAINTLSSKLNKEMNDKMVMTWRSYPSIYYTAITLWLIVHVVRFLLHCSRLEANCRFHCEKEFYCFKSFQANKITEIRRLTSENKKLNAFRKQHNFLTKNFCTLLLTNK